jgi:hypothetical protein
MTLLLWQAVRKTIKTAAVHNRVNINGVFMAITLGFAGMWLIINRCCQHNIGYSLHSINYQRIRSLRETIEKRDGAS